MKIFEQLSQYATFSIKDVEALTGNLKTAYSSLQRYLKKGLVIKVRTHLYSPIELSTGMIKANKYQIACAIHEDAYLTLHSALEFHGLANQVFNEVYVSSSRRFNHFEFQGTTYKYIKPKIQSGVITAYPLKEIRLTDLERTLIDSIHSMNKITGYEEFTEALSNVPAVDEDKLIEYLGAYHVQSLYQKTGYIFEKHRESLRLSDRFFTHCAAHIHQGVVYLTQESMETSTYNRRWQVMEPSFDYMTEDDLG